LPYGPVGETEAGEGARRDGAEDTGEVEEL
jgi:hypothetical protein